MPFCLCVKLRKAFENSTKHGGESGATCLRRLGLYSAGTVSERKTTMKRTIAGLLLTVGMGAGTMFASDGYWRDRRDIGRDEARIAHDRREVRRDLYYGNYAAARHEDRKLRNEYRDLGRDRRDLYWDRR